MVLQKILICFFFLSHIITMLMIVKCTDKAAKMQRQDPWKETDDANIRGHINILVPLCT